MKTKHILTMAVALAAAIGTASFFVEDSRHESAVRDALPELARASNQLFDAVSHRAGLSQQQPPVVDYVVSAADGFKSAAAQLTDDSAQSSARQRLAWAKETFDRAQKSLYCASAVLESTVNAQLLERIAQMELTEADESQRRERFDEAAQFYGSAAYMASLAGEYYQYMFMDCSTSGVTELNTYNQSRVRALKARARQSLDQLAKLLSNQTNVANGDRQNNFSEIYGRIVSGAAIDLAQRAKAIEATGDNAPASIVYAIASKWQKEGSRYASPQNNERADATNVANLYALWAQFTRDHSELPLLERTSKSFEQVEHDSHLF